MAQSALYWNKNGGGLVCPHCGNTDLYYYEEDEEGKPYWCLQLGCEKNFDAPDRSGVIDPDSKWDNERTEREE
tara:strand:+ start:13750 stop:13968 length:219 start_codon:yes stop_codon:yes gene_type:complete